MKCLLPVLGLCLLTSAANAAFLEDNFNRANSSNLGTISAGGSTWTESTANDAQLSIANNALNFNLTSASRHAYVGATSTLTNFTISMDIQFNSQTTTSDAWMKIVPVGPVITEWWKDSGWMLRRRAGNKMDIIYYQAGETDVQADVIVMDAPVHIEIVVTGNTSTLVVGNQSFTTPAGKDLGRPAEGTTGYFHLQFSAGSGQTLSGSIDNLVIAVPEPATAGLSLGLGLAAWARQSRQK